MLVYNQTCNEDSLDKCNEDSLDKCNVLMKYCLINAFTC